MKYERLTDSKDDRGYLEDEFWVSAKEPDIYEIDKIYQRLAELEDKIDAGTLVELPCKPNKFIYEIWYDARKGKYVIKTHMASQFMIEDGKVNSIKTGRTLYLYMNDLGKKWFFTEKEATARLEELGDNNNEN